MPSAVGADHDIGQLKALFRQPAVPSAVIAFVKAAMPKMIEAALDVTDPFSDRLIELVRPPQIMLFPLRRELKSLSDPILLAIHRMDHRPGGPSHDHRIIQPML